MASEAICYRLGGLSGRLGNRLLQHLDAFNYAERSGLRLVSTCRLTRRYLQPKRVGWTFRSLTRKWRISNAIFEERALPERSMFVELETEAATRCAMPTIHFRGTDFAQWKAHSIIGPKFFLDATEALVPAARHLKLVTDDPDHPHVHALLKQLEVRGVAVQCQSGAASVDFRSLAAASLLIASPSTFALAAALFGRKHIVYPRAYALIEAERGADFWRMVLDGHRSPYVRVDLF